MNTSIPNPAFRNSILASLPNDEVNRLRPHLISVPLKRNQTLHNPGETIETIYFLEEGICSIVSTMEDGNAVEVGIIGKEGFVGLPAILGTRHSLNRNVIQLPGSGYSIKAKSLGELCDEGSDELRQVMLRAVQGLLTQTAQTAACNRVHRIEERLSRWLLMCHDRVETDAVPITHEFLAIMLGTRRSTVTLAIGMLQKAGFVQPSRGKVIISNRAGLEGAACECYSTVHQEFVRLGLLNSTRASASAPTAHL